MIISESLSIQTTPLDLVLFSGTNPMYYISHPTPDRSLRENTDFQATKKGGNAKAGGFGAGPSERLPVTGCHIVQTKKHKSLTTQSSVATTLTPLI